ncbi:hypothetical protein NDU88_004819 [Pleurodeles waltl]|uniref:Uncharacterized protein n=1 Tax=Pleurodeles waltl TaxID=8319 RepID=A0AAV7NQF0_PLEWA|nr:hypothetical protein NDU88_004819 [Pleurodeles waltl]
MNNLSRGRRLRCYCLCQSSPCSGPVRVRQLGTRRWCMARAQEKGEEPTGVQILAAIESSSRATQTQIEAIVIDVNLLRAVLRVVAERSVATEQKVTCMQSDVDKLKASVAILEAKTRKLEACVEDAEGRARRCNLRVVGFPERTMAVQLQRQPYAGVKRKLKDLGYTYMLLYPAKLKVLHAGCSHFFQSPEAAWDQLERNDGTETPESLRGRVVGDSVG